jgi:hypothetical protein
MSNYKESIPTSKAVSKAQTPAATPRQPANIAAHTQAKR